MNRTSEHESELTDADVLLVDDSPVNQRLTLRMLEKLGCRVHSVANGKEAVQAAEATAYDVILMDCEMPRMDGFEATAAIRARQPPGTHVPIVAMTAHATPDDRERCMSAGMDDYISKPVRPADLRAALIRRVGRAGGNDGHESRSSKDEPGTESGGAVA